MDGRVLDAPAAIRWFIVNVSFYPLTVSRQKPTLASGPMKLPLVVTSTRQREALAARLDIPVALGMRYGNPSTRAAIQHLLEHDVEDLFIMPMYPHYAMSSYETAVVHAMDQIRELQPSMKTTLLQPFYQHPDYINALVERARPSIEDGDFDKLVFSFHGIPQRHLVKGDPSHQHCLTTHDCCNTCHPAHHTCYR